MPRGSNFQKPYPPEFRREAVETLRGQRPDEPRRGTTGWRRTRGRSGRSSGPSRRRLRTRNFETLPAVVRGPHELGHPAARRKDWLAQNEELP